MAGKPLRPPAYLLHRATGQARVRIAGKDHYLGPHGSPESKDRYADVIAAWRLESVPEDRQAITIDDLALAYMEHAREHYSKDGRPTSEVCVIRSALRFVLAEAGRMRAREFGPKMLKAVRESMIAEGLCRTTINASTSRIRRMFRWAVAEELLPATVLTALQAVNGLRAGRSKAKEPKAVAPVSQAAIDAIRGHVSPAVWAAVQVQLLTGMRSGEVLSMRACDLTTAGTIWEYRPLSHKTQHHGKFVFLGPKAQAVMKVFLTTDTQARLFASYRRDTYRRAISRACERVFGMPDGLRRPDRGLAGNERNIERNRRRAAAATWRAEHCWFQLIRAGPFQLRAHGRWRERLCHGS